MRTIKKKDIDIIMRLRNNARESLTDMSKKINIPVSTIYDRLKEHHGELIKRHTSLLDFAVLGFNTRASICIAIDKQQKDSINTYLHKNQYVNSVFKINNGYDFMIDGVFRSIKDMEDFCDTLRSKFDIRDLKSFYIIEELAREEFLTKPELIPLLNL